MTHQTYNPRDAYIKRFLESGWFGFEFGDMRALKDKGALTTGKKFSSEQLPQIHDVKELPPGNWF